MKALIAGVLLGSGLCLGSTSHAAVIYYPTLDVAYNPPSGTNADETVGPVSLGADAFVDPNTGSTSASSTRYYGGTLSYTPNTDDNFGGGVWIQFPSLDTFGKTTGGDPQGPQWRLGFGDTFGTANGDLPFVIKIRDLAWNVAEVSVFVGANALTATEGSADLVSNRNDILGLTNVTFRFTANNGNTGGSAGSLNGFFSATEWTPVAVPEPASLALLAAGLTCFVARRRR